jgi:RNA polymerase subunit RPABC4/transcription elongation factor Spt4
MSHDHNSRFLQHRSLCEECFAVVHPDVTLCPVCRAISEEFEANVDLSEATDEADLAAARTELDQ